VFAHPMRRQYEQCGQYLRPENDRIWIPQRCLVAPTIAMSTGGGVHSTVAWMVHDQGSYGPQPGAKARVSTDEPNSPHVRRDDEVRQQHLDLVSRSDPIEKV
jgi:hypothetical protein